MHPKKFKYPLSDLRLRRGVTDRAYSGDDAHPVHQNDWSGRVDENDKEDPKFNDPDPSPNDTIYDLKTIPEPTNGSAAGQIYPARLRYQFSIFAAITIDSVVIRCSEIEQYFVRFSASPMPGSNPPQWTKEDPPAYSNDNKAGDGTTPLTVGLS